MILESATGLVRSLKRSTADVQRAALEAAKCARIYDWKDMDLLLRSIRKGDMIVITMAHVLGPTRAAINETLEAIYSRGGRIFVADSGLSSDTPQGAAQIALDAVAGVTTDRRTHTTAKARKCGKQAWKHRKADRVPKQIAAKFWHAARNRNMSIDERLAHPKMHGWSQTQAYVKLGPPGNPKPGAFDTE